MSVPTAIFKYRYG